MTTYTPSPDLADAWRRFQAGERVTDGELRDLDEDRADWALGVAENVPETDAEKYAEAVKLLMALVDSGYIKGWSVKLRDAS